jgi:hypothetical protein
MARSLDNALGDYIAMQKRVRKIVRRAEAHALKIKKQRQERRMAALEKAYASGEPLDRVMARWR